MKKYNYQNGEKASRATLKNLIITAFAFIALVSCGEKTKPEYTVLKDVNITGPVNPALAADGEKVFKEKCTACHKYADKYVGPPLGKVTERRTANFILSQILYPEQMIKNNDTIKALIAQFPTPMANQHLSMDQAKAVYEHLRAIAANGGNK
jgi:cytochrome c551/c552